MNDWVLLGGVIFVALLAGTVFFGAPYVPTRPKDILLLFNKGLVTKKDVLIDLGSGDGVLLKAAAMRGIKSYGIELSPLLVAISAWRLRRFRHLTRVRLGNYWHKTLPDDVTVVFVFLAAPYMKRLEKFLEHEATRLGRPLRLISYGFELPDHEPVSSEHALLVYEIKP